MLKQVLKAAIVSAVLLALASPAWAGTINTVLDDPTSGGGSNAYALAPGTTGPYSLTWQSCSPWPPVPGYEPASGYEDCLAITNNTGFEITNLMITVPDLSDTFNCSVSGSTTGFSCSVSYAAGMVTLDFIGIPGFVNDTEIYIGVGCAATATGLTSTGASTGCPISGTSQDVSGVGEPTLSTPTHDPDTLVLLVAGMAMLGMFGVRRHARAL